MLGDTQSFVKDPAVYQTLSPRERQVLAMATAGLADKQIGRELGVSVSTLRTYWDRIREKLGAGSRAAQVSSFVASEIKRLSPGTVLEQFSGLVIDLNTKMVEASDEVNREHGFEPESVHSLNEYYELLHLDDRAAVFQVLEDVASGKTRVAHVICRCMALEQERTVSYMLHGKLDDAGKVAFICGYRTDSRDVRSGSYGRVKVGFFERWIDGEEVLMDDASREILGMPAGQPVHRTSIITAVHPEDRWIMEDVAGRLRLRPTERVEAELRFVGPDGSDVPVKVVLRGHAEGDRIKIIGTVTAFYP